LEFLQSPFDQRALSAVEYALSTVLTELVTIPGSWGTVENPRPTETISRGRPHLLVVLRRWFECILGVHACGYSLRGQFNIASFTVGARLQVKMTGIVHLFPYSRLDGGLDYTALVSSIEQFMTLRELVPPHLRVWLDLIGEGVNGVEYLIRYHTSLMEPRQAFDFVLEARNVLDQVRVLDPLVFDMIISLHPELADWDTDSYCVNWYMDAARRYADSRTGKAFEFAHDLTGVLTVGRNCSAHPARYLKNFMVLILEDDFPGLVARFQRSIFRAGLLPIFQLDITMA
jgi:hypothetical protein